MKSIEAENARLRATLAEIRDDDERESHPCGPREYGHFGRMARDALAAGGGEMESLREMEAEVTRLNGEIAEWSEASLAVVQRCSRAEAEVARLNGQIAEWSKTNLEIVARCSAEEKRAAELAKEVARLEQYVPSRFVTNTPRVGEPNDPRREKKKG